MNGKNGITAFYLTALNAPVGNIWYKNQPMGIHTIEKAVKRIMGHANVDGHFTNTSLRRTARTRMMEAGIPNKIAKKMIGKLHSNN